MRKKQLLALILLVIGLAAVPTSASAAKPQLLSVPPQTSNLGAVTFEYTIALVQGPYQCRIDGGPIAACGSQITYTNLPDGPHLFEVRANHLIPDPNTCPNDCDPVVLTLSDFASFPFTIDRTAPTVAFTGGPKQASSSRATTSNIGFASELGSTFVCTFDKRTPEPCESPVEWRNIEFGLHRVIVQATDAAGNVGPGASLEFAVNSKRTTFKIRNKTTANRCTKTKRKRRGKVLRTKKGKIRYKTTCKRVKF